MIDLSADDVARLEGGRPGRAEAEAAAPEFSAVSTGRSSRTEGDIGAVSAGGPCIGTGGESGTSSDLLGAGSTTTAVSAERVPAGGFLGGACDWPVLIGALDATAPCFGAAWEVWPTCGFPVGSFSERFWSPAVCGVTGNL